LRLFPG